MKTISATEDDEAEWLTDDTDYNTSCPVVEEFCREFCSLAIHGHIMVSLVNSIVSGLGNCLTDS
jgi:hypothetical protein